MIDIDSPLSLLGGLSPQQFMRRHWQRKPLLIRQAIAGFEAPIPPQSLFALAARQEVQSRLIAHQEGSWQLRRGPFTKRQLPPLRQPQWTLLVQSVDLYDPLAHALLQRFAFIPQARLDDLMISYASDGGGVGPHFDSYDVFLLQAAGRRRWRIGKQRNLALQEGVPLRILAEFEPEQEWLLEPGDMLYLPPGYAHDGIAEGGGCMTYSIGFRSPSRDELSATLLERLAEPDWALDQDDSADGSSAQAHASLLYRDPTQPATAHSGEIPTDLQRFARDAVLKRLQQPHALEQLLGEYLSEPNANVDFQDGDTPPDGTPEGAKTTTRIALNAKTRMLYDSRFLYINGESYRVAGKDARLLRALADQRSMSMKDFHCLSDGAQQILQEWSEQGWVFFV